MTVPRLIGRLAGEDAKALNETEIGQSLPETGGPDFTEPCGPHEIDPLSSFREGQGVDGRGGGYLIDTRPILV